MKKTGMLALMLTLVLSLLAPAITGAASHFADVTDDFWAADEINYFTELGVIKGYGDGTFRPGNAVTRGEAAVMLARALELDTDNVEDVTYDDVDQDHPYYKEIAAVTNEGIMQGKPGGEFDSTGNLQRAHMAVMLANAFQLETDQKANFPDVANDFYAVDEINAIYAHGITTGFEDNTFRPSASTTRAQFVTFLDRVLNPVDEDETDLTALLKEVYANEMALETYEFEGSATLGLTLPDSFFEMPDLEDFEIDPELLDPELGDIEIPEFTEEDLAELEKELEMIRDLLGNIEVDVKGTYQLDPMLLEAEIGVNIPGDIGINLTMPMIMTDTKMWIKFPEDNPMLPMPEEIAGKYIEFDLEELAELDEQAPPMNMDWDLQMELAAAIYDLFFDHFGKDFYHEVSADAITIPSGVEADTVVKFELTNDNLQSFVNILFKGFLPGFFELLDENPEFVEAMGLTPELIEMVDLEEMAEFVDEISGSINDIVNINTFEEYIVINEDNYIVYDLIDIDVELNLEGEAIGLKLKSDATKTNINGEVEFEHGIPNPEDVISFEELLEMELELEEAA